MASELTGHGWMLSVGEGKEARGRRTRGDEAMRRCSLSLCIAGIQPASQGYSP